MSKTKKKHKRLFITLISLFVVIALSTSSFFIYVSIYEHPTENALTYMEDSTLSEVKEEKEYITFQPKINKAVKIIDEGLIFYPGGKVDEKSYAPLLRSLSDLGVTSVLVKMPFRLAIFNKNGADKKQQLFPKITNWFIGGHSLGGAMASDYLSSHSEDYSGLILLGSYSTKYLSSKTNLSTLSLLAENDKVLNKEKYESNKKNLPALSEVTIQGGIHSYFGDYGIQNGDGTPTITFEEQNRKIIASMYAFMVAKSIL